MTSARNIAVQDAATGAWSTLGSGLDNTAGCSLLVAPDLLAADVAVGGTAVTALALPASAAIVGVTVHQQVAVLELDVVGNIVALTATNALAATIGVF